MNKSVVSILLIGAALLAGLFLQMRPSQAPATPSTNLPARIVDFSIKGARLIEGSAMVQVAQHTPVTLRFFANQKDEVHLHGYDLTASLEPGEITTMTFIATNSGRFEIELHNSHAKLAVLEVQPR